MEVALQADLRRNFDLVEHNRRPGKRHPIAEVSRCDLPGLGRTWIERHQRRKTVGIDGRVVDSTIAREPRSGYREPVMREPACDSRLGLFALAHLSFEVRPQSAERSAEHASKGWRSEVGQPSASLVGEAPQRFRPVPIGEEAIEQRAVRILRVAARPVVESTTDAIDRLESGRRCCAPDYLAKVPGIHAALPCLRALLERCDAFDRPQRQRQIGEEHRVSSERPLEAADPSKRSAQVNDVRVLVCEDQPQPVVCVRNRALAVRSGRADLDQVVRDGRGPPVWQVALVHQHNVHAPGC